MRIEERNPLVHIANAVKCCGNAVKAGMKNMLDIRSPAEVARNTRMEELIKQLHDKKAL